MYLFLLLALPAVWGDWTSQETLQEQSALVAELSLDGKMNDCLLRTYCLVGAHETRVGTIAEAISSTHQVFSQIQTSLSQYWDQMTNIRKLKTAFDLGSETRKPELCSSVFRCDLEENLELSDGRTDLPNCDSAGAVCPPVGIGCALCGMFLPGVCSTICPFAGVFCGATGYLCMLKPPAPAPAPTTTAPATTVRF